MPNKHFCQGPTCHEQTTQDRFLKSRGVVRGRYAEVNIDHRFDPESYYNYSRGKYFCSQACQSEWLNQNMECVRARTVVPFITHRRESGGYEKVTTETSYGRTYSQIERVDNRTEID